MKILDYNGGWGSKVNFVDGNNVVLGYYLSQDCCEHADWFIADEVTPKCKEREDEKPNLEDWNFDTSYFQQIAGCEFGEGGMAVFRITNGCAEKFIHLFNSHNGSWLHGFELEVGGTSVKYGLL